MHRHPSRISVAALLTAAAFATALPAAAQQKVEARPLASAELDVPGVVADVIESTRKEGVLTVRVRFRNTGDKPVKFLLAGSGRYDDNYLSAGNVKYTVIRDAKKHPVATPTDGGGWLEPKIAKGGSWNWWAKFPAPPADRTKYTLYLKVGPPIDDVPIIDKP
ncbi:MAG: hypothetical protein NDI88_11055 [Lysobacter sp.]|nr:hypothetical protein [Lysobacter sp.]